MALESHVWSRAREKLSPFGMLIRLENAVYTGTPDVVYCLRKVTGFIETKATIQSLKLEQVMFGEQWALRGGLWHMLLMADNEWFLFNARGARGLHDRTDFQPVVRSKGQFPLKPMLMCLSPRSPLVAVA